MTPDRMRIGGVVLLISGAVPRSIGVFLRSGILRWRCCGFRSRAGLVIAPGGQRLVTGRRPRSLLRALSY